jgi:hypothetical protein
MALTYCCARSKLRVCTKDVKERKNVEKVLIIRLSRSKGQKSKKSEKGVTEVAVRVRTMTSSINSQIIRSSEVEGSDDGLEASSSNIADLKGLVLDWVERPCRMKDAPVSAEMSA